mmetsp:Transcript_8421/g.12825  ORF Transcript_8421/g.12825 Transcript_8421/m.12825 type:complete len:342 (+) Transcript_8421:1248-2273(+)
MVSELLGFITNSSKDVSLMDALCLAKVARFMTFITLVFGCYISWTEELGFEVDEDETTSFEDEAPEASLLDLSTTKNSSFVAPKYQVDQAWKIFTLLFSLALPLQISVVVLDTVGWAAIAAMTLATGEPVDTPATSEQTSLFWLYFFPLLAICLEWMLNGLALIDRHFFRVSCPLFFIPMLLLTFGLENLYQDPAETIDFDVDAGPMKVYTPFNCLLAALFSSLVFKFLALATRVKLNVFGEQYSAVYRAIENKKASNEEEEALLAGKGADIEVEMESNSAESTHSQGSSKVTGIHQYTAKTSQGRKSSSKLGGRLGFKKMFHPPNPNLPRELSVISEKKD